MEICNECGYPKESVKETKNIPICDCGLISTCKNCLEDSITLINGLCNECFDEWLMQ